MRILIACIHYPVCSGRFIRRALERLGHDVKTAGPYTANQIWGMEIDARYNWLPDFIDGTDEGRELSPTGDDDPDWYPDLIITADSAYTLTADWERPHILWGQDNHVRDYRFREWKAMFLCHTWGARMDEPNAHWLPPCYDPMMCTDLGRERDIDVTMVGYPYPDRQQIVQELANAGLKVQAGIGAVYDEYNALYNRSKIGFVKSNCGDVTNRVFENMAQGCCVLADEARDFSRLGLIPYRDYWPYRDAQDAVKQARHLIESGLWQTIARQGKIAGEPHTWDARAQMVLETVKGMVGRANI